MARSYVNFGEALGTLFTYVRVCQSAYTLSSRTAHNAAAALAVRNEALGFGVSVWILRRAMEALAGDIDASMKNAATATASMSTLARLAAEHTEAANRAALALQGELSTKYKSVNVQLVIPQLL